jgi:hypothetical protein
MLKRDKLEELLAEMEDELTFISKPENFAEFLGERQKLLAKAINGLLNSLV